MHFAIFTLFPGMFQGVFDDSILRRAWEAGHITLALHDIRDYAEGKHRVTDDTPYGGGGGMIMKPGPICRAVEAALGKHRHTATRSTVILLSPQGRLFTQHVARELAQLEHIALICGRYEGVDERVSRLLAADELSIGDYVLSGGEIPAMVLVDAVTRLLPGVLGDPCATAQDSHAGALLEHPHFTRPPVFRGEAVPEVLLSGHHRAVELWRRQESLRRTLERRPDLLQKATLTSEDRQFLQQLGWREPPP
jgi:tRNA (guanine37-N1)-methyltransferase